MRGSHAAHGDACSLDHPAEALTDDWDLFEKVLLSHASEQAACIDSGRLMLLENQIKSQLLCLSRGQQLQESLGAGPHGCDLSATLCHSDWGVASRAELSCGSVSH